jgi:hypothetical protein
MSNQTKPQSPAPVHHLVGCGLSADDVFNVAVNKIIKSVTDLIQSDPHQWSTRPCQTCQSVSSIIGYSFGCVKKRQASNSAIDGPLAQHGDGGH